MQRISKIHWLAACAASLALAGQSRAAEVAPSGKLEIHELYMDGNFPRALNALRQWLEELPTLAHEDSVFAYKHLGVMHAASPDSRDKGRQFLRQMLLIEPQADLLDMFATDAVTEEFRKVQTEHAGITAGLAAVAWLPIKTPPAAAPVPPPAPLPAVPRPKVARGKQPVAEVREPVRTSAYWLAGGASLVAAAGGIGLFLYLQEDQQKIRNITIGN